MRLAITILDTIISVLTLVVFIYALLSFFLNPYHPIRRTLGQIVEPILQPIRKVIPPTSGIDFSTLILILLLQVIGIFLEAIIRSFA